MISFISLFRRNSIAQWKLRLIFSSLLLSFLPLAFAEPPGHIETSVSVDPASGDYSVKTENPEWTFHGTVGHHLSDVKTSIGQDKVGSYKQISFQWTADNHYLAIIRWYKSEPALIFTLKTPDGAKYIGASFPNFQQFPKHMHRFSYIDHRFAPAVFNKSENTSTPWLFFNEKYNAFIISPGSDFIVSKMQGDGKKEIASGLNPQLRNLPKDFSHRTLLILGKGIRKTWARWGQVITSLYGRHVPTNESDPILEYYGYWTDHGADYYYDYNKKMGYENTLLGVENRYKKEGIKLGYMQLDSWWYQKSIYGADGKPNQGHAHKELPRGSWNRYGGLMKYRADKFVFPHGVADFQKNLGLPLVTHNRWVDPHSAYHENYKIIGLAAVDLKFWQHIAQFLKKSGIIDYEQDWLSAIYHETPSMANELSVGNAFTDNMDRAMTNLGIDMQYCMATPRFFLQGVKYNNLTTIRTSDDRFEPARWHDFLYASQFASALGIWPWTDVFKSHETGNMIVSVLSAGPVGTGDALGKEDVANIREAARPDGVLVKPDMPLMPLDSDYLHAAKHEDVPMLAATYTEHGPIRTSYVFAFAPEKVTARQFEFKPETLGQQGRVVVYDPLTHASQELAADQAFSASLKPGQYAYTYYVVAPVEANGIAFLGDAGKIASTGKTRISQMHASQQELEVRVQFGDNEKSVTLIGHYEHPIKASRGTLKLDPQTRMFTLTLPAPSAGAGAESVSFTKR